VRCIDIDPVVPRPDVGRRPVGADRWSAHFITARRILRCAPSPDQRSGATGGGMHDRGISAHRTKKKPRCVSSGVFRV
jgi:hypothetical protein